MGICKQMSKFVKFEKLAGRIYVKYSEKLNVIKLQVFLIVNQLSVLWI